MSVSCWLRRCASRCCLPAAAPASAQSVSFAARATFAVGFEPSSVAVGDFNGDSDPDLAVANDGLRRRLDPARRRGRELHWADQLRRRRLAPARSRWATSTATPTPTSRSRTEFRQRLDPARRRGRELHAARPTSPSATVPARSRWATSTATPTPTSRSRTRPPTTSRSCSAPRAGASPAPTNFAAGTHPVSVAVGDFNGDSDPDLAVANSGSDNVSILLGGAGGELQRADQLRRRRDAPLGRGGRLQRRLRPRPRGCERGLRQRLDPARRRGRELHAADQLRRRHGPVSVAVGDFNGDSDPDLAVANQVCRQRLDPARRRAAAASPGRPTSPPARAPSRSRSATSTATRDPDLAVANQDSDNVSILLGGAGGELRRADQLRRRRRPHVGRGGRLQRRLRPRPGGRERRLQQRLDPARRRAAASFSAADQLRRRRRPPLGRGRRLQRRLGPRPRGRATGSPTTSRSCSARAGGELHRPDQLRRRRRPAARSRSATSTATRDPDLAVANQGSDNVSILLGDGGGSFSAADQLRRRHAAPPRSRWATSTATPTPTSRSRTRPPTTSRSCSATAAGASPAPTNFAAGDGPSLGRGGRLQRRLRPRPRGRERVTPATSRSCSAPRGGSFTGADRASPSAIGPVSVAVGDFNGDSRPRPRGRERVLRQRLDPARRRGRSFTAADQLRRRRTPLVGRGGRLQRRLGPRHRGRERVLWRCRDPAQHHRHQPPAGMLRGDRRAERFVPPNRKLVSVTLRGATDPDGDSVTLTITGVTQDESVNGEGDGNTSPDATRASAGNEVWSARRAKRAWRRSRIPDRFHGVQTAKAGHARGRLPSRSRSPGHGPALDSAPPSFDSFSGTQL